MQRRRKIRTIDYYQSLWVWEGAYRPFSQDKNTYQPLPGVCYRAPSANVLCRRVRGPVAYSDATIVVLCYRWGACRPGDGLQVSIGVCSPA